MGDDESGRDRQEAVAECMKELEELTLRLWSLLVDIDDQKTSNQVSKTQRLLLASYRRELRLLLTCSANLAWGRNVVTPGDSSWRSKLKRASREYERSPLEEKGQWSIFHALDVLAIAHIQFGNKAGMRFDIKMFLHEICCTTAFGVLASDEVLQHIRSVKPGEERELQVTLREDLYCEITFR